MTGTMGDLLNTVTTGLGTNFPDIAIIFTILAGLLMFSVDLRMGALILFIATAVEFMLATLFGIDSIKFLMAMLISFVIMVLTLYSSSKRGGTV